MKRPWRAVMTLAVFLIAASDLGVAAAQQPQEWKEPAAMHDEVQASIAYTWWDAAHAGYEGCIKELAKQQTQREMFAALHNLPMPPMLPAPVCDRANEAENSAYLKLVKACYTLAHDKDGYLPSWCPKPLE